MCRHVPLYTPRISVGYGCGTELRIELRTYIVIPILLAAKSSRNVEELVLLHGLENFTRNGTHSDSTLKMEAIPKPQGSVVIIGAGTQGRRLAHMVSADIQDHKHLS